MTVSDESLHETHLTSESQHQPLTSAYYNNYNNAEVGSDLASPYYPDYTYNQPSGPTALSSGNCSLHQLLGLRVSQLQNCSLLTGETGRGCLHFSSHLNRLHCCSLRRISLASHITGPGQSQGIWNQVRLNPRVCSLLLSDKHSLLSGCLRLWGEMRRRQPQKHPGCLISSTSWQRTMRESRFEVHQERQDHDYSLLFFRDRPAAWEERICEDWQTNRQQTDSILALI